MAEKPFCSFLGHRRRELRLTQMKIVEASQGALSQPLLSEWENGNRTPSLDDQRLEVLGRILQVPVDQIRDLVLRSQPQSRDNTDSYLKEVGAYVDLHLGEGLDVWVLGSVSDELERFVDQWVRNLQRGISYHMIWILDLCVPLKAWQAWIDLERMVHSAKANSGEIHHYGIRLLPEPDHAPAERFGESPDVRWATDYYNRFRAESRAGAVWHEILALPWGHWLSFRLLEATPATGVVTLFKRRVNGKRQLLAAREPLAVLHLPATRMTLKELAAPTQLFLDTDRAFSLATLVGHLELEAETARTVKSTNASPAPVVK